MPKREKFQHLGSIFRKDSEIVDDITHMIQVGWLKQIAASGGLYNRRGPPKLKEKFYRTAIRLTMLYETECWVTKKQQVIKMSVAEMRMLRWMCGKTRNDRIRNANIHDMIKVVRIYMSQTYECSSKNK